MICTFLMWRQCLREESDFITTMANSKDIYHFYTNIIIFMQVFKDGKPTKNETSYSQWTTLPFCYIL